MIYMFLAEGFEEVEALAPLDLLRRAGADVKTVAVGTDKLVVEGAHNIEISADLYEKDVILDSSIEMIILPGGMPGTLNLDASSTVHSAIDYMVKNNGYIAAICAAPSILGKRGLLSGKEATCYPGFEDKLEGAKISGNRVVKDGKIITAAGMGVAVEFGLELVATLFGKARSDELRRAVIAD